MRRFTGQAADTQTLMLAQIVDLLRWLVWAQTEDGHRNRNRPPSMLEALTKKDAPGGHPRGFETPEAFEEAYRRFTQTGDVICS